MISSLCSTLFQWVVHPLGQNYFCLLPTICFSSKCEKRCRTAADISVTQWPLPIWEFPVPPLSVLTMMCLDVRFQIVWIVCGHHWGHGMVLFHTSVHFLLSTSCRQWRQHYTAIVIPCLGYVPVETWVCKCVQTGWPICTSHMPVVLLSSLFRL